MKRLYNGKNIYKTSGQGLKPTIFEKLSAITNNKKESNKSEL